MGVDYSEFTFQERDDFHRKPIAENTIKLLNSSIDVSPLIIDGGWGTGKTEFCHKLINLMKENDDHHLIYVDAFQADHADEPLLTVLAEVVKVLPDDEIKKSFMQKALPAVRFGVKALAKAGTSFVLRQDAADIVDDFDKEIQKAADKAIDASVELMLKDHVQASKNLSALQDALKDIAKDKPIILFIDELDRCRPDFAVSMLEIIKHTFDVEGVQFVLITNTQQLKASINHCYGVSVDAQRYLDKFVKFTFSLPILHKPNAHNKVIASVTHYKKLTKASEILKDTEIDKDAPLSLIERIITVQNISLREIETLVRHLEIYQELSKGGLNHDAHWIYKAFRILGVVIYSMRPELSSSLIKEQADAKQLCQFFGETTLHKTTEPWFGPEHYQSFLYMLVQECDTNVSFLIPEDAGIQKVWDEHIDSLWNQMHRVPQKGKRSQILTDAIDVIQLNSQ